MGASKNSIVAIGTYGYVKRGDEKPCYCVEVENNPSALKRAAQNLIESKILFDGKSIAEAEKDIDVEFFT